MTSKEEQPPKHVDHIETALEHLTAVLSDLPVKDNYQAIFIIHATLAYSTLIYDVTTKQLKNLGGFITLDDVVKGTALTYKGEVFVIVGGNSKKVLKASTNSIKELNLVQWFDPSYTNTSAFNEWDEIASIGQCRSLSSSTACDGYIYVVGGCNGEWVNGEIGCNGEGEVFSSGERYDCQKNKWSYINNMNVQRTLHALAALEGKVYAIGGFDQKDAINSAECYDPLSDEWAMIPPMETKRACLSAAVLNNEIYAIGGTGGCNGNITLSQTKDLASVEKYNLESGRWSEVAPLNQPRSRHGSCVINGKIYAVGGMNGPRTIEVYDPKENSWTVEGPFERLDQPWLIVPI